MEGCFLFQWGGVVFQMRGASFLSGGGGVRLMGGIGFDGGGGGGFQKNWDAQKGCPKRLCRRCLTRT